MSSPVRHQTPSRLSITDGLTLGFEVESHAMDPKDLSCSTAIAQGAVANGDAIKEFHKTVVEHATNEIFTAHDVRAALVKLRLQQMRAMSKVNGIAMHYSVALDDKGDFAVSDSDRYRYTDTTDTAITRYAVNSGIHVHVGVDDPDVRIEVANRLAPFQHVLVALTGSSPINDGYRRTFGSYRVHDYGAIPTVFDFQASSYEEYLDFAKEALLTVNKTDVTNLHPWVRPVLDFNPLSGQPVDKPHTVEVRLFDAALTLDDQMLTVYYTIGLVNAALEDIANGLPPRTHMHPSLVGPARERAARQGMERMLRDPFVAVTRDSHEVALKPAWEVADAMFNEVRRGLRIVERRSSLVDGTLVRDFDLLVAGVRSHGTGAQRVLAAHDYICASLQRDGKPVADAQEWRAGKVPMTEETAQALKVWLLHQNYFGELVPGSTAKNREVFSALENRGNSSNTFTGPFKFMRRDRGELEIDRIHRLLVGTWRSDLFHSGLVDFPKSGLSLTPLSVVVDDSNPQAS